MIDYYFSGIIGIYLNLIFVSPIFQYTEDNNEFHTILHFWCEHHSVLQNRYRKVRN